MEDVTFEQRARTAREATGSQVQLPVRHVYRGMAHGLPGSVLNTELYMFPFNLGSIWNTPVHVSASSGIENSHR